jgi:ParB family transcriptional regulator, chromosome partitioning protein
MNTAPPTVGTTTRVPMADFIVDSNIRKDITVPKEFLASVKQHGVLVPVDAYLADDGRWHLQDGQLRYLASLDAGKADLPVLVADPATADAARVQRQLILNELRNEITDSDRVGAYQTLFDLGVSAEQIAKKTSTPAARVKTAL